MSYFKNNSSTVSADEINSWKILEGIQLQLDYKDTKRSDLQVSNENPCSVYVNFLMFLISISFPVFFILNSRISPSTKLIFIRWKEHVSLLEALSVFHTFLNHSYFLHCFRHSVLKHVYKIRRWLYTHKRPLFAIYLDSSWQKGLCCYNKITLSKESENYIPSTNKNGRYR